MNAKQYNIYLNGKRARITGNVIMYRFKNILPA